MIKDYYDEFIKDIDCYNYTKKMGLKNIFEKLCFWEENTKDILNWDKGFLLDLCKNGIEVNVIDKSRYEKSDKKIQSIASKIDTGKYSGLYTQICYLNYILEYLKYDNLELSIKDFKDTRKNQADKFFTKEEIKNICECLTNVQDKFIIYGLFSGIKGKAYSDLVQLKVKDIKFAKREIKLPSGKIIKMDEYLEKILREVTDDNLGRKYYKLNRSGVYDRNTFYELNMSSEYVLKVKPTKANGNGLGYMSFQGMQTRLQGLMLLGKDIYKSGVIHHMYTTKLDWTQAETGKFIKVNNYGLTAYETHTAYKDKYLINKIKYNESDDINLDCINDYDSYNSVEIKREKEVTIQRLVRNTTIAKEIKGIYDNRCQLCECQLKSSNGGYKSEAHHIKPYNRTHNGDDCCDNLIVLCPNCHTQFDDLYYAINPKTFRISCIFEDDEYHNAKLYKKDNHYKNLEYIEYAWSKHLEKKNHLK